MMSIDERIAALQEMMEEREIEACIILSSDPHLSEYLPDHWQLRQWFSGFTGSAGTLVVLKDKAYIWADSRYWVQAEKELSASKIELQKVGAMKVLNYPQYLATELEENSVVAVLASTISAEAFFELEDELQEAGLGIIIDFNPFDDIWKNRPALPQNPIYVHQEAFVSESRNAKLARIREEMEAFSAQYHLVSTLDDIAWILNLRGNDITYNPLFLSYLLIEPEKATLYIEANKVPDTLKAQLNGEGIALKSYEQIYEDLSNIGDESSIMLDFARTNFALVNTISQDVDIVSRFNPSALAKACKNTLDIVHTRQAMEEDGAALCYFFADFEEQLAKGAPLSELTVANSLVKWRRQRPNFVSLSFSTIAGYNENGALPHYHASDHAYSMIKGEGLLLIDSGAHYQNGTTDITRVIPIGMISAAQKKDFTIVLKSMITMSQAHFPKGVKMPMLDAIGRAPMWQAHLNYGHGTGHGVGYFMNVHEGPHVLSYHAKIMPESEVKVGMITSIEPGLYRQGQWGIRIENLVVVRAAESLNRDEFGSFMEFETLTLCPIDTRCIEVAYLSENEVQWLNNYHQEVYTRLAPKIDDEIVLKWLQERTQPI